MLDSHESLHNPMSDDQERAGRLGETSDFIPEQPSLTDRRVEAGSVLGDATLSSEVMVPFGVDLMTATPDLEIDGPRAARYTTHSTCLVYNPHTKKNVRMTDDT
jgi:hypothetical protein